MDLPLRTRVAAFTGRLASEVSRKVGTGAGSNIGGRVTLAIDPHALELMSAGRQVALVSGTNGKTTTSRMLAHVLKMAGKKVGLTTTDGLYIDGKRVLQGDLTGPWSAQMVLRDPTVDFAVLETARGGILRAGLGFDYCDIGAILNVSEDHLGLRGIETLEELAYVKAIVIEVVRRDGFSILNAEDPHLVPLAERARGTLCYFSLDPDNEVLRNHLGQGGIGATLKDHSIVIRRGSYDLPAINLNSIPATFNGRAMFNVANAMVAALAAHLSGVSLDDIRAGLKTFDTHFYLSPGRLNLEEVGDFHVLLDYAHNVAAYRNVAAFIAKLNVSRRVGVIAAEEYRRAIESRWLFGFAVLLSALIVGVSYFGLAQGREVGFQGFARVTTSLMNLALFVVPLTGLLLGVTSVAGTGSALPLLLAQPVSRGDVLLGKFLGLGAGLSVAQLVGYGGGGALVAFYAGAEQVPGFLTLTAVSLALGWLTVSASIAIAVVWPERLKATSAALLLWLLMVVAYDLAVLGAYAMHNEIFQRVVGASEWHLAPSAGDYTLYNGNTLLGRAPGVDGVKIGWTDHAGWTFVASAVRNGHRVMVTVLDSQDRDADAAALFDWAYGSYDWIGVSPRMAITLELARHMGVEDELVRSLSACA